MKKRSAGLLLYRRKGGGVEVLIAHMGGPWWAKKDKGAWSIPKGEYEEGEDPLETAKREFSEELGKQVPGGELMELGEIEQKNNKIVTAWALEADIDVTQTHSNTVSIEWPPRSGQMQDYPEIDRAAWVNPSQAISKLIPAQAPLVERLMKILAIDLGDEEKEGPSQQGALF